jgi:4-amino-4-deoxy-L-arabinose transferase-like glycosyltransferase
MRVPVTNLREGKASWPAWQIWVAMWVVALAVRLLFIAESSGDPLFDSPRQLNDSIYYHHYAQAVAAGQFQEPAPYYLAPLYYHVLGALYFLCGPSFLAAKIFQCILGAISCCLLYDLGRRLFGNGVGLLAGLLFSAYGLHIYYSGLLLPTVLVVFLNLCFLRVLVYGGTAPSLLRVTAAGLLLGIAAAAKPHALLLVPLACLWLLAVAPTGRKLFLAGSLAVGTALAVAPFTIHNYLVSDRWVLLTTSAGRNLLKGNGPTANGTHVAPPAGLAGISFKDYIDGRVEPLATIDDSDRLQQAALDHMRSEPAAAIRLLGKKLLLFFNQIELFIRDQFYFARQSSVVLRTGFVAFGWIAPLGLVGLLFAWRRRSPLSLLHALLLVQVASFTLLFVLARYRLPAASLLTLFAAAEVMQLVRLRRGPGRSLLVHAVALVLTSALVWTPFSEFPRDRGFGNQWERIGNHAFREQHWEQALEAYQAALGATWLDDDPSVRKLRARLQMARAQLELSRPAEARKTLQRLRRDLRNSPAAGLYGPEVLRLLGQLQSAPPDQP